MNLETINVNKYEDPTQFNIVSELAEFDHGLNSTKTSQRNELQLQQIQQKVSKNNLGDFDQSKISYSRISPYSANSSIRLKVLDHMVSFSNCKMRIIRRTLPKNSAYRYPYLNDEGYTTVVGSELNANYEWDFTENSITWKTYWNYGKTLSETSYYDSKNKAWYHYVYNNATVTTYQIAIEYIDSSGIYTSDFYTVYPKTGAYIKMKDVMIWNESILRNIYPIGSVGTVTTAYESGNNRLKIDIDQTFGNTYAEAIIEYDTGYLSTGLFQTSESSVVTNYIYDSDFLIDYTKTLITSVNNASVTFNVPVELSDTENPYTSIDINLLYKEFDSVSSFDWSLDSSAPITINTNGILGNIIKIPILSDGEVTERNIYINNIINNASILGLEIIRKRVGIYNSVIIEMLPDDLNDYTKTFGLSYTDQFDHRFTSLREWQRAEEAVVEASDWLVEPITPAGSLIATAAPSSDLNVEHNISDIGERFPLIKMKYTFGTNGMTAANDWYFRYYRGTSYQQITHARTSGNIVTTTQSVDLENCTKYTFSGLGLSGNTKTFECVSFLTKNLLFENVNPMNKLDFYTIIDPTNQTFILGKQRIKFFIKCFINNDVA